jgi:CHAD domain-containing protein
MSMGEFVWRTLRRDYVAFCLREPGARLGEDIEDLHQLRVSSRRLRTALRLFRDYLPARAERFNRTLRWTATALGEVRDMDVKIEQVNRWKSEADPEEQASFDQVLQWLGQTRARRRRRMQAVLDSARYQNFLKAFETFLLQGPSTRSSLGQTTADALPRILDKVHAKVIKAGRRSRKNPVPEHYHQLRIACKRQRYTLEFVADLCGPAVKPFRKALIQLQDVLGQFNDAVVGAANIRQLVREKGRGMTPAVLFTLGRMEERCQVQAPLILAKVPRLFRRFQDCPWKKLRRSLG